MMLSNAYRSSLSCKVVLTCLPVLFTKNKLSQIINAQHKYSYKWFSTSLKNQPCVQSNTFLVKGGLPPLKLIQRKVMISCLMFMLVFRFSLNQPTWPIQFLSRDIRLSVCFSVCLRHWMHFFLGLSLAMRSHDQFPGLSLVLPPSLTPSLPPWKLGNLETWKLGNLETWKPPPQFFFF